MELYLLEYLVAFRDCGTVEAAAERLNVTAPTVSRGLKKLEGQLGVALLDRTPARISLNATGEFAADRAAALLARVGEFRASVRAFAADRSALRVAATVPGVLPLLAGYPHAVEPVEGCVAEDEAARLLADQRVDLCITTREHGADDGDGLESVFLGRDALVAKLTEINPLHDRASVSFADLAGHEFVLPRDIGAWRAVLEENARDAMLIYQDSTAAFEELVRYSNFPIFRTRLTDVAADSGFHERRAVPVSDAAATLELYATYRAGEREGLAEAVRWLAGQVAAKTA